jgi:hypothetical protein
LLDRREEQILENDRRIRASAKGTEVGRRLMEIPASAHCSPVRSSPAPHHRPDTWPH